MKKSWLLILCLVFTFSSCAKKEEKSNAEIAYTKAMTKLKDRDYNGSAEDFEKIGDEYPLSKWALKGKTMAAYSYYKESKYEDVIKVAEDFIQSNPNHSSITYMQYLKSMSYYNQISDIQRAQDNAKAASYSFRELIARFPLSKYAADAKERLILVDNHIAGAKMAVGRYQLENKNYVGAIKNFQEVVDRHFRTNQAPEAYFRLFETYKKIGLENQAAEYKKVLSKNYPDNRWSKLALGSS
jgi:outer membrane protein assembly factor BamD